MTAETQNASAGSPEWVSLEEAPNYQQIRELIPNLRSFYWELGKDDFKRQMVERGALLKAGKSWRVSVVRAPAVIEEIFRGRSLAALDRTAAAKGAGQQRRSTARDLSVTA